MSNKLIEVRDLTWAYRQGSSVLNGISFEVAEGEIVGIIGPNGCGKTTLLHLVAGLLGQGEHGEQTGSCVLWLSTNKTHLGFVFQNYRQSLLPWRTVYGNIAAGRELLLTANVQEYASKDDAAVWQRINELELEDVRNKYPFEISGGQAQLTCLARALALDARLLILDEPTSSLHYNARNTVLDVLLAERSKSALTILFSSHSLEEASFLADRVLVLSSLPAQCVAEEKSSLSADRRARDLGSPAHLELYRKLLAHTTEGTTSQ